MSDNDIKLGFGNLTTEEAQQLLEFHARLKQASATARELIRDTLPAGAMTHPTQPPFVAAPPAPPMAATTANTATPLPPQPVTAPNAAPSTGPSTATVPGAPLDKRGVPWNRKYHSGEPGSENMSEKGAWRGRKGTSQSPLAEEKAAYEAQFLGNSAVAPTVNTHAVPSVANTTPLTGDGANTLSPPSLTAPSVNAPNVAPLAPPAAIAAVSAPPPGCPSMVDFMLLWEDLTVTRQLIGPEWLAWVMAIGGHPKAPEAQYAADPEKRLTVYNALRDFQLKHAA